MMSYDSLVKKTIYLFIYLSIYLLLFFIVPTPVVIWFHYTPQWCTVAGRVELGQGKTTEECKEMCREGCPGVEWWDNYNCVINVQILREKDHIPTRMISLIRHMFF